MRKIGGLMRRNAGLVRRNTGTRMTRVGRMHTGSFILLCRIIGLFAKEERLFQGWQPCAELMVEKDFRRTGGKFLIIICGINIYVAFGK